MNKKIKDKTAVVLVEDTSHIGCFTPRSGWDLDNRGADGLPSVEGPYPEKQIRSVLRDMPTTFKRDITEQSDGIITLEAVYTLVSGEGFYFKFANKSDYVLKTVYRAGAFYIGETKAFAVDYGRHYIKFELDMEKGKVKINSDKKYVGEFEFNGTANSISSFVCGFEKEDVGHAALMYSVKMYKNYYVYDFNINLDEGSLPADYKVETTGAAKAQNKHFGGQFFDYSYLLEAKKDSSVTITRPFDKTAGNVILDMKYLLRDMNGEIDISLCNVDTPAFEVCDRGVELICDKGALKKHSPDVWQTLRAEIDFSEKTVLIKLNGKKVTVLALSDESLEAVNNLKITFKATGEKTAKGALGEIFVFPAVREAKDYVPEPIVPEKKGDYVVGMNICPLWRTGDHYGWDCISPYEEIKPLMGYYDEGIPETADWEIKFLAEHGVDFELYCWYASQSEYPMRSTRLGAAWYNGHFNAKYSDKCKFALLWEAAGAMHQAGSKAFRKYIVPFWVDYFFSDPRYMTIDNKAIMSVYGGGQLIKDFGSPEAVKKELDYLRSVVKSLGYDDLIILCCAGADETMKQCGFDGGHAYNWGKVGCDVEQTKNLIKTNTDRNVYHIVPTVSTGFNNVAWAGTRSDNMTVEGMKECLEWCRDEMLPKYPKDSWQSKLVMLSNWNEYGEGTYICPSGLNGFGYLDSVRSVFCKDIPHSDAAPSEHQKKRINIMHPADRAKLGRGDRVKPELRFDKPLYKFTFKDKKDLDMWQFDGFSSLEIKDGKLVGHSDRYDPYMLFNKELPFDPDKVSHIVVNIHAYKPIKQMCCTEIFFSTTKDKEVNHACPPVLTVPEKMAPLTFTMYDNPAWRGEITAFRLDPIWGVGDFVLDSVEFYEAPEHTTVRLDGQTVSMPLYAFEKDGECYFCFDPKNPLANVKELYYEWNKNEKTLTLFGKHQLKLTIGSEKALFDGEPVTLKAPVDFIDGMPVLPMSWYAKTVGYSLKNKKGEVDLITK